MNHSQIKQYCLDRLNEARPIIVNGTPWGFLCLAAFIDFLAKLAKNVDAKGPGYKDFFKAHAHAYADFRYANGAQDLPEQFYHVLRCGICHSFSLKPDAQALGQGGREKSIHISHDGLDDDGTAYAHLSNYTKKGCDAAVLLGGSLCDDLTKLVCDMFSDVTVQTNAEAWVKDHPPINGI
jgi:hypothetical protein